MLQSGKSSWIKRLLQLREKIFKNQPRRVFYIYTTKSKFVDELYQEKLIDKAIKKLPSTYEKLEEMIAPYIDEGVILIIDDGLSQLRGGYLPTVFEEFASKNNTSVLFVSQSIFVNNDDFVRISQNCHYIVFMANKRNPARIRALAQQVKPCNQKFILKCYNDAIKFKRLASFSSLKKVGYGYLILDFTLPTPDVLMCRTNIFPDEIEPITVYVERE